MLLSSLLLRSTVCLIRCNRFRGAHCQHNLSGLHGRIPNSLRIYPYPMVRPLPRPWSETMVSIPLWAQKTIEIKGFLGLQRPFLDLVSQTLRPRGGGRTLFAEFLMCVRTAKCRQKVCSSKRPPKLEPKPVRQNRGVRESCM